MRPDHHIDGLFGRGLVFEEVVVRLHFERPVCSTADYRRCDPDSWGGKYHHSGARAEEGYTYRARNNLIYE